MTVAIALAVSAAELRRAGSRGKAPKGVAR
jgi:hypothetical protein